MHSFSGQICLHIVLKGISHVTGRKLEAGPGAYSTYEKKGDRSRGRAQILVPLKAVPAGARAVPPRRHWPAGPGLGLARKRKGGARRTTGCIRKDGAASLRNSSSTNARIGCFEVGVY